jgi:hypothetical protein
VTFQAPGEADIRATFSNVTGTLRVSVTSPPPGTVTLSGVVTDTITRRPVAGARLEAVTGPNAGRNSTTDGNGFYSLALMEDTVLVRVTKTDYETREATFPLRGDVRLDFTMTPILAPDGDVSRFFGTYNVTLRIAQQNCAFPVTPATSGQVVLSGQPSGSGFTVALIERGTTRSYSGSIDGNGNFGGTGGGIIGFGIASPNDGILNNHDYSGSISGRVTGNSITGTEFVRYGEPCPGSVLDLEFSGDR